MDSGFSEEGVFGQALIKPRGKGWPVLVLGKYIDKYFTDKQIGYCETLKQVVNGVKFCIHCQKEETYVTKSCPAMMFLIRWRIMRLYKLLLIQMALGP